MLIFLVGGRLFFITVLDRAFRFHFDIEGYLSDQALACFISILSRVWLLELADAILTVVKLLNNSISLLILLIYPLKFLLLVF